MGIHAQQPQIGQLRPQSAPPPRSPEPVTRRQDNTRIETLLTLEADVRKCKTLPQLQFLIANETSKLIPARQTLILHGFAKLEIITISSLATLDNTSPTLRWLENSLATPLPVTPENEQIDASQPTAVLGLLEGKSAPDANWPFCNSLRIKLPIAKQSGNAILGLLSEKEFSPADQVMAARLADTYAHAWNALAGKRSFLSVILSKKTAIIAALLFAVAMFIPVTMTVLAPVEIIARNPAIVAAPLGGVIETVELNPNTRVQKGDLLFTYASTDLVNELEIAGQSVEIAKSRYRRASQDAFGASNGRREMAELKSELDLALAKFTYAQSRLELSRVRASKSGVILFSDRDEWIGKPVVTGEKIMSIADPTLTDFLIKLPIGDSIILEDGSDARIFLDADPLNPVAANIVRRSFHAKPDDTNTYAYELVAQTGGKTQVEATIAHRIGIRGTAQLYGKKVPLAFFLFRKPLSSARQFLGL